MDGEILLPGVKNHELESVYRYNWGLSESQQYVKLWEELLSLVQPSRAWSENFAVDVAEKMKLNLPPLDVQACLNEFARVLEGRKITQKVEFYDHLVKHEEKRISNELELWNKVKEKFPLIDEKSFRDGLDMFYPCGEKLGDESAEYMMDGHRYIDKLKGRAPIGDYYKMKMDMCRDLGLIKQNEDGVYIDNFDSSTWTIPTRFIST